LCINIQYWPAELGVGVSRKRSTRAAGWWVSAVFFLGRAHALFSVSQRARCVPQYVHEVVAQ